MFQLFALFCFSLVFEKSEVIYTASINSNFRHFEFDRYIKDGSLLTGFSYGPRVNTKIVRTGKELSDVVPDNDFASSFLQLTPNLLLIVSSFKNCIKIFNREENSTRMFAGVCNSIGFVDGPVGKFHSPESIDWNIKDRRFLLVTDQLNNALRSVEISTGAVSTVVKSGFNWPSGFAWYNGRLLVLNQHYISEVAWNGDNPTTNTMLTTTTSKGYHDGDFSMAQFNHPEEIIQLRKGYFLISDSFNHKLRLLDMHRKRILPVCVGSTNVCNASSYLGWAPVSLLKDNDAVIFGMHKKITKLTGK